MEVPRGDQRGHIISDLRSTYPGERAPQYIEALVAFGVVVVVMVVVAGVRRHRGRKKSWVN